MKKIILLCSALISTATALGQTNAVSRENGTANLGTLSTVRYYKDSTILNCIGGYGTSYFSIGDALTTHEMGIIEDIDVKDFVIDNDTVFFCGQNNDGTVTIGLFDIEEYFNTTHLYQQIKNDNISAADLTKIETYIDSHGRRHIASIGNDNVNRPVIVEAYNIASSSWESQMLRVPDYDEQFFDITLAEDYIVVAGFQSRSDNDFTQRYCPTLRLFHKDSICKSSPMCDTCHIFNDFTYYNDRMWYYGCGLSMAYQPGSDEVTLVSTVTNLPDTGNYSLFLPQTHIANVNLTLLRQNSPYAMVNAVEINLVHPHQSSSALDLLWNESSQSFIAVRGSIDASLLFVDNHFFEFNPSIFIAPYPVMTHYGNNSQGIAYRNVTIYDYCNEQYILSGPFFQSMTPEETRYIIGPMEDNNSCTNQNGTESYIVNTVQATYVLKTNAFKDGTSILGTPSTNTQTNQIEHLCE